MPNIGEYVCVDCPAEGHYDEDQETIVPVDGCTNDSGLHRWVEKGRPRWG